MIPDTVTERQEASSQQRMVRAVELERASESGTGAGGGERAELKPLITVTGADEKTRLDELAEIAAEIGLLYTATPEGRNRYPRRAAGAGECP